MSPLLPEYVEHMNVPICTVVTALSLDSGEIIILEFGKGMWFVNIMDSKRQRPG